MTRWSAYRVEVPTPYTVGPANCYLLAGDALVLIDTGPLTSTGLDILKQALRKVKARLRDLDAILLTHAHVDHFGMGSVLRDKSDARIYTHGEDRTYVEDFPQSHYRTVKRLGDHSVRHGFPAETYRRIATLYTSSLECGRPADVDRIVKDGDKLEFGGGALVVMHTPGHTPGSVCYHDPKSGDLFVGDTVLEKATPIAFFRGHAPTAKIGLSLYLESLQRLKRVKTRRVCPGHRPSFPRFRSAVHSIERHVERTERHILRCLNHGERSAWEVSREVFPDARLTDQWLAFAKTLGMLEHLMEQRCVEERDGERSERVFALRSRR